MKRFLLFRHGETDWNRAGRMQGSADIALNALGIEQAEALRDFFQHWRTLPENQNFEIFSSPLARAQATVRIALGLHETHPLRLEPRLAETKLGQAEGMTREQICQAFGEESWLNWIGLHHGSWLARFPGGESKGEVRDRALEFLNELARGTPHKPSTWILATHGGLMRRLLHHFHPHEPAAINVHNGAVFQFEWRPVEGKTEGEWIVGKAPLFMPDPDE